MANQLTGFYIQETLAFNWLKGFIMMSKDFRTRLVAQRLYLISAVRSSAKGSRIFSLQSLMSPSIAAVILIIRAKIILSLVKTENWKVTFLKWYFSFSYAVFKFSWFSSFQIKCFTYDETLEIWKPCNWSYLQKNVDFSSSAVHNSIRITSPCIS